MTAMHLVALAGSLWIATPPDGDRLDPAEPYLQRWGYDEVVGHFDYHPATNRMVTRHSHRVVLWDLLTGLAVRDFASPGDPAAVAFTADGQSILVAAPGGFSPDGGLKIFDVASGAVRREFPAPPSQIHDATISPDGRYVAAGCYHHTVSIWDARTGKLLHRRKEHSGHVNLVRFSPDGKRLLSGGYTRTAILWDVPTGEVLRRFPLPCDLAWGEFSPDGKRLVTASSGTSDGGPRILVWDIESRQPLDVLRRGARAVWFTDEGLVLLEPGGELTFVDLADKKHPRTEVPGGPQPGGRVVVAKSGWQLRVPKEQGPVVLAALDGFWQALSVPRYGAVTQRPLDFSPDGRRLLTAFSGHGRQDMSEGVTLWDLDPPRPVCTYDAQLARFHPDGRRLLIGGGLELTLHDLETLKALTTFKIEKGCFESVQFLDGGRRMLTAGGDWYDGDEGHIAIWDTESGKEIRSLATSEQAVYYAAMNPKQDLLAATFTYGEAGNVDFARVLDARSGEELQRVKRETHRLLGFTLGPQGKRMAAYERGQTSVWEPRSWNLAYGVPGIAGSFNPDGSLLATHTVGVGTHLWQATDGTHLRTYPTGPGRPAPAVFHPGGATLLLGSRRDLQFWDLRRKELIARLATFDGPEGWLALSCAGHVAGTKTALERITWRDEHDPLRVRRDPKRVAERTDPKAVGKVLKRSLPAGESLVKALSAEPERMPEAIKPRAPAGERPVFVLRGTRQPTCAELAGDAEGRLLLVSQIGAPAVLWRLRPVGVTHRFPACEGGASVALTPDGKLAVVEGPSPGVLGVWDTQTGRFLRQLSIATENRSYVVLHLSTHSGNRYLAAVYETRDDDRGDDEPKEDEVVIWDLVSGEVQRRLRDDSPRRMRTVAFTPDGTRLLIGYFVPKGSQGDTAWEGAELWVWQTGRKVKTFELSGYDADHPAFSADGKRMLLGEGWGVTVRSFPDGKLLARVRPEDGTVAGALTADGKTLVAATLGSGALVRSDVSEPEKPIRSPGLEVGHCEYPRDLWIGGSQKLVFSPWDDGRVSVYRLGDMRKVAALVTRGQGEWLVWTDAGYYACSDGARPYLAWNYAGRPCALDRFARWTELPDRVAETLSGEDVPPADIPDDVIPAIAPPGSQRPPTPDPWSQDRAAEAGAIELARKAGAELRFDDVRRLTFVKIEERPVADRVLRSIPALRRVDRLYLADTGIRDDHLRGLGLMTQVKRLSLWGNPITDRGLAELACLWRLEALDVHDTDVTEASLQSLRHIETLRTLIVPEDVDAEKLGTAMNRPDLEIIRRARP